MSKTGHSFIKDTIAKESALLGGEMSGHIFFNDKWPGFDDAIFAFCYWASYVEKHFTIVWSLPGRDNMFAVLPEQLKDLTDYINNRNLMLKNLGLGYNEKENDSRLNYTGRFNG